MKLDRIEVKGFKSIRKVELELRSLNVLIGANGAGKSNFIALFNMLNQMMQENLQVFVAQSGGADFLMYFGQKVTDRIQISLRFGLDSYYCELLPTSDDNLIFGDERCFYEDNTDGHREGLSLGAGHRESYIDEAAKVELNEACINVLAGIRNWKLYHFHDTSDSARVKKFGAINDNFYGSLVFSVNQRYILKAVARPILHMAPKMEILRRKPKSHFYLRPDAGNLAAFLYKLQLTSEKQYEAIRDTIRLAAPFFDDFILRPSLDNPDSIRLEWRERGSDYPFLAHHLSDGTLRFMCLATLLLQPDLPSTLLIDEPELGLHPYAINVLASLMRSASARAQIIVSTQSVSLVNQFEAEDLFIVEREGPETVIKNVDSQRLREWIEEYSLGELWEKNVLGGRPS